MECALNNDALKLTEKKNMKINKFVPVALLLVASMIHSPADAETKKKQPRRPKPKGPNLIVPKTALDFWNSDEVQGGNNCYNYATNRRTDSFAQPGEASGQRYDELTCASVLKAAGRDLGLARAEAFSLGQSGRTLIALVVAPGSDFHWYRRDRSGRWSHKPGSTAATIHDNSGNAISNPETADRGMYTEFCGYFSVKNFAYRKDQQNGGYVRIGSMTRLPALPGKQSAKILASLDKSEAEVMIYSGRPNPRVALRDLLADQKIGSALRSWASRKIGENALGLTRVASRLGDNGVAIHDSEGLLLAQGSVAVLPSLDALQSSPELPGVVSPQDQEETAQLSGAIRDFVLGRQ